jgi:hypothetical protein
MFCNSDSWDSAISLSEDSSRRLLMGAFYFLYGRFPRFPRVRGSSIFGDPYVMLDSFLWWRVYTRIDYGDRGR